MKQVFILTVFLFTVILSSCKKEYQCLSCDEVDNQTMVKAKNETEALMLCKDKNCSQALENLNK